jgi:predicted RNA-binding Zn ribbon-like protein
VSTPAPGESARPALALVNSRRNEPAGPVDHLANSTALRRWLVTQGLPADGRLDPEAMRELRVAVRELLLARIEQRVPDRAAVDSVNAAAAPAVRRLTWSEATKPHQTLEHPGVTGTALARALLATDAIDLLTGPDHANLRACAAPGCARLLLKDHPRREWCSARCGDRVRASRYYRRRKAAGAASPPSS